MPNVIRDSGGMWNTDDALEDTKCLIPDRCYATFYQAVIDDCKAHGQFDVSSMGNVSNVGLMAQKAEEYGSHDKTFEVPSAGDVKVICNTTGKEIFTHAVEEGDIWRMCQTKDAPIKDWVRLAVSRARATGAQTIFWLDADRAHDSSLIAKVDEYLKEHDTTGLDLSVMKPVDAVKKSMANARSGKDSISVTGNVLRDYLTDLFPILELGTSAKMLSIVPLLEGGGLYETGAGGSAPKHVQQFVKEGHLRWDSLGEYLALAVSLEGHAEKTGDKTAKLLADTLNKATGALLDNNKSPSRKGKELDNRGSTFYIAKYWAEEMAKHDDAFKPLAESLASNEDKIISELIECQGPAVDLGGYWKPDFDKCTKAMRSSPTFNAALETP
jgi:isocitrate dehydrogenase